MIRSEMLSVPANTIKKHQDDVSVLCLGAGYAGRALLSRLRRTFETVYPERSLKLAASTPLIRLKDTTKWAEASDFPIQVVGFDLRETQGVSETLMECIVNANYIISTIPPLLQMEGGVAGSLSGLITRPNKLRSFFVLSSTSVYGKHLRGEKAKDESYSVNPRTEASRACIKAEKQFTSLMSSLHIPLVICRLGGLYGPGRNFLDSSRRIKRSKRGNDTPVPRIYVGDLAAAISELILIREEEYQKLSKEPRYSSNSICQSSPSVDFINIVDDFHLTRRQAKNLGKVLCSWITVASKNDLLTTSEDDINKEINRFSPFLTHLSVEEEQMRKLLSVCQSQEVVNGLFEFLQQWDEELSQAVVSNSKLKHMLERPLRHPSIVSAYIEMALKEFNRT